MGHGRRLKFSDLLHMKILVITNLFPPHYLGGYELICHAVVGELRRRGHQVNVLTSGHKVAGVESSPETAIERSLKIHGFYGHPWLNILQLGFLERVNNQRVLDAIARHQPELIYVWNMGGLSKSILLTLQRLGLPTVFYLSDHWIARGLNADVWLRWWNSDALTGKAAFLRTAFERAGLRGHLQRIAPTNPLRHLQFQRLYFCSRALRKLTAAAGFEVMHGAVIYCPVDTRKFDGPVKPASAPLNRFLWVGRLAEDKGIMTALKAVALLGPRFNARLRVYGRGDEPYVSKLKEFARNLPVDFTQATMREMPAVYRAHDALLFTSEWAEPFALTPLEAMASGLPVIGTTTGGSCELFRHADNALTYTAGEPEQLAERILELIGNGPARQRMAAMGQAEVRLHYAEEKIVDQIETYLEETLRTWKPAPLPHYRA